MIFDGCFIGTEFVLVELLKKAMTCRYDKKGFFFKSSDEIVRYNRFPLPVSEPLN